MPTVGRPKGQGSIVPDAPTPTGQKRWRVAVTMADGHRVYRRASSPREAERIRRQLVEARELDLDPSRLTLAAFLRGWIGGLRDARHQRIRPRTMQHYEMIVERHVIPSLGHLRLSQVTVPKVQAWLDADDASPRTVHHHRAVLRRALNVAVRQRLLAYNPAALVELPDVAADKSDPLTLDEVHALLDATREDRLHPLWRLALATGLRLGELLGLAWEDVDLGRGMADGVGDRMRRGVPRDDVVGSKAPLTREDVDLATDGTSGPRGGVHREGRTTPTGQSASITVRAQLQRLPPDRGGDANGWARTPPKAARTLERIAIGPVTAAVLAEHKVTQAAERVAETPYWGLVFRSERGYPYHNAYVLKEFHRACGRASIRPRRIHDLRHTANAMEEDLGVSEPARMARHGWSTTKMARKYGGASEAQDRRVAEMTDEAM